MFETLTPATTKTDAAAERAASVIERLFPEPRAFGVRLWDGTLLHAQNKPVFTLMLNTPGSLRRMFSPPVELSLGEAFIHGDFDIEGDIFAAFSIFESLSALSLSAGEWATITRDLLTLPKSPGHQANGKASVRKSGHTRGRAQLSGAKHSRERDQAAIQYHYDVGNDFYALWLDEAMQYSCAYFPTGAESLNEAQQRKMEHIFRKLRLKPGERLLDIGCGWGGLAMHAVREHGVHVVGVTLSREQVRFANDQIARAALGRHVQVKLLDYRDLGDESFDKIVSVGMFEHVGKERLPEYFAHVYRLLKPGGLFLNHGIAAHPTGGRSGGEGKPSATWQKIIGTGSFIQHYVFPDGELVPVSEVNLMAEQTGFEVRDVENLREHYALTLRHWVRNLEACCDEAIEFGGNEAYRTWRIYMAASAYGFERGKISVNQSLLAKLDGGISHLPLSRADLYPAFHARPYAQ